MKTRLAWAALAVVCLGGYTAFLIEWTSFSVGGSDSSGYANTARRIVAGTLVDRPRTLDRLQLPDDWALIFIPLGFAQGPRPGTMAPYYPPGFPAHEALAAQILGWARGPFLVAPFTAALCLIVFYAVARQVGLPRGWSTAGTLLLAAWPVFIGQAVVPMSDVPATLWALVSVSAALRTAQRPIWAVLAGAAFGLGVLVRPTNFLLIVAVLAAMPWRPPILLAFAAGGAPFAAALAVFDIHCFGNPLESGYRKSGLLQALAISNFPPRAKHYGLWLARTLTPLVPAGWLACAFSSRRASRLKIVLVSWFAAFFVFYCFYQPYDSFMFVRFLLPGSPALLLGALLTARELQTRVPRRFAAMAAAAAAVSFLLVLGAELQSIRKTGVLGIAAYESTYPEVCRWTRASVPRDAVVLSMAASGALEYYTDLSIARWDWLDPARFKDLRDRTSARRVRLCALLFPFEEERLSEHAPGNWRRLGTLRGVSLLQLEP